MKKPSISKAALAALMLLLCTFSNAQDFKPFKIRYNKEIKGNMLLIGNNILGKDNDPLPDNNKSVNDKTSMKYIDIDGDAATFSSSSANLKVPPATTCFRIAYAGLYWGALIKTGDSRTDIEKIKFKLPGSTTYTDITGEIIYDANIAPIFPDSNKPYTCYADVTSLLSGLVSPQGTYMAANIKSSIGDNGTTGLTAGWTLFVVYEDPKATTKSITTFDGFTAIYDDKTLNIPISGFQTPPSGVIDIQYGFAAFGGDKGVGASKTEINGKAIVNPRRASNQFFDSAITEPNGYFTDRVPNSQNTLGFDTGIESILGADKSVINHGATTATITVQVAKGQANPVFSFFSAFAVDVIAPDIALSKVVKNASNNDIGGTNVSLGDNLFYEIGYQNVGNDHVTKMTIKDVLPKNVVFNYPDDLDLTNSGGITVANTTYDPLTRTIIFKVPDGSVEIGDPPFKIRIKVQVVTDCNLMSDACSNEIKNQAFASYSGIVNTKIVNDEGSFASTSCNFGTGQSTNFLVGLDQCTFTQNIILCVSSVVLKASDGYTNYSWSRNQDGSAPIIGTSQTFTATQPGIYYVHNTAPATCKDVVEAITVSNFETTNTNPVIPFADQVVICPNNGKPLPNIFLCGANDVRVINTGINATSIVWEKLNKDSCPPITIHTAANPVCANENTTCTWQEVGRGPDYTANIEGQFRISINYLECFSEFYFNVYQNLLNPTVTTTDSICTTKGSITVGGVPLSGYEYSLDNNGTGKYQSSNVFTNVAAGFHTVYLKQIGGATNPCIFKTPEVYIKQRNVTVTPTVTQPLCYDGKGSVNLAVNDALKQYYYKIYQGSSTGALVGPAGPTDGSDHTFFNLIAGTASSPATYTWEVSTDDGCHFTGTVDLIMPDRLTAKANLTTNLTCQNGEITVDVVGGTAPFIYYVNSTTVFQNTPKITVTNPLPLGGDYKIDVVDSKGCTATTSIKVAAIPPPVYSFSQTNVDCYNDTTGEIKFDVTNTNGYTLSYGISTDEVNYTYANPANPTISNLAAGDYYVNLKYSLDGVDCFGTPAKITITQPATALTASAGVSELAGCGPNGEGKVRITNPQGGTPFAGVNPYQYEFGDGVWGTAKEKYMMPSGTPYIVHIKDANDCVFEMEVILNPAPAKPNVVKSDNVYNCDGTATSTFTVINPQNPNYSYEYFLNEVQNTTATPHIFTNVSSAVPNPDIVTVKYKLLDVPTYSNLLKEDFGYGDDTTSPGINTSFYCWERQVAATQCKGSTLINDGDYSVTARIVNPYSAWVQPGDHTPQTVPPTAKGRSLVVNIGDQIAASDILYQKTISDIIPGQPINFELYVMNLLRTGNTQTNADLRIALVDAAGVEISWFATGEIPKTQNWEVYPKTLVTLDPKLNTTLKFIIRSNKRDTNGNDVAIDDIRVFQLPKSCVFQEDIPVVVDPNKAFKASATKQDVKCFGTNTGSITITAQNFKSTGFEYTLDNWVTTTTSSTSPVIIPGLGIGNYEVKVRYDNTGTCSVTIPLQVSGPTSELKIDATATPAKCVGGATVTATGTGGTLGYSFQLIDTASPFTATAFPASGILNNVPPGTYTVKGTDANGCTDDKDTNLVIAAPAPVTAVVQNTGLCFDPTAGANITVNVSGGTGSYSYQTSIDGGTYSVTSTVITTATFTYNATATGTYKFKITDSYGCSVETVNQVINAKLTAVSLVTTGLDCDVAPANQAVITGTISGGTTPFTVTVGSGTGTFAYPTTTTFTYTTGVAGTYTFEITDAIGCKTTTAATVNPIVPVTVSPTKVDPTCNGSTDGSIKLTATGEAPFTYSITGVSGLSPKNVFGGLAAGTYNYIVRDSKGCDATGTIVLDDPAPIVPIIKVYDIKCNSNTPGSIEIYSITGGVGSFVYTLYNSTNTAIHTSSSTTTTPYVFPNNLLFGDYYVTIVDSKGCEFKSNKIRISTAPYLKFTPPVISGDCITGATVDLSLDLNFTSAPNYIYSIYGDTSSASSLTAATTYQFTGLKFGQTYFFQVVDSNGCFSIVEVPIAPLSSIKFTGITSSNVSCNTSPATKNGTINFTVSNYDSSVTQLRLEVLDQLTNMPLTPAVSKDVSVTSVSSITDSFTGLAAGSYTLQATEIDGTKCSNSTTFEITQPTQPLLSAIASVENANCNKPAQLTLTTTGGTGPYTYAAGASGFTPSSFGTSNVLDLDYSTRTNWDIVVEDAKGCQVRINKNIDLDPSPVIALAVVDKCVAEGAFEIKVTATTAGIGAYTISVNGSTFNSISGGLPHTVTGLNSGSNTISIKDANGCIDTKTILIEEPLQLRVAISVVPTCINADGEVTLTASGGTIPANYQYSKDGSTYGTTNVFTGLAPSATPYMFWVKDTATSCTKSVTVVIEIPNQTINFSLSKTDVTCKGGNDGTITVDLTTSTSTVNNNPIYTYDITPKPSGYVQAGTVFSNLTAGYYTVTVTSGRGCEATNTITIDEPAIITVPAPTVVQYACNAGSNTTNYATITVTGVTGGSGVSGVYANYQFIKTVGTTSTVVQFGTSNTYTETDLLGGNYTIKVYDNKGCSGTVATVINPFIALDKASVNVDKAITCAAGEDITVSVTMSGSATLQYSIEYINGGAVGYTYSVSQSTGAFTGLPVGNYIITVTNTTTGCSIQTVHYVKEPNTFGLKVDKIADVQCFGSNEGSVKLTLVDLVTTNNAGGFTYTIDYALGVRISGTSATDGTATVSGLKAGIYTVTATMTATPFCKVKTNFTINQPTVALEIKETHTAITCVAGNNDGSISVTASGGWSGWYEFQLELGGSPLVPWSTVANFTDLSAGNYTVRVRDSKLCSSVTVDVSLVNPTPIAATVITDKPLLDCFGYKDATITVTSTTGGSGNYLYTLVATYPDGTVTKNGPQQPTAFSGLGVGSYQVLVSDNWSCSNLSNTIEIKEPTEVKPNLVLASRVTCNTQATLTLSATGGTAPYTYSSDNTTYSAMSSNSVTFPVPVGTYHYYVKDAKGCVSYLSNDIKINALVPLTINLEKDNPVINCAGDNNGVIVATAQGGLGNYKYTLLDGTGTAIVPTPVQSSPGNFTGLFAGDYKVHVDSEDCDADKNVTITAPGTPLTVAPLAMFNVTCNGFGNGKITMSASGGTGIIKYAISPRFDQWFETGVFDKLKPGTYDVIAQDQNGCYILMTGIKITEPKAIIPSTVAGSIVPEICFGDNDGAFSIEVMGGTAPYSVSLDNINGTYTNGTLGQTQFDFTGLTGGDHTVYIKDANLCTTEWTVSLPKSVKLNPQATVTYACVNNAPGNIVIVSIDASITNPTDVDYSLDGASYQMSNVFTNVPPGTHSIKARHTNGCEKDTPSFTITAFDPLALTLADGGLNEIVATTTGGSGGYKYTFNGEDNGGNNKYIIYKSGDYAVTVTDANGCVASATRHFEYIDVCIPNYFTPNGDGVMDGWAPGCTINYKDLTFDIFDRYGRKIATYRLGQYWDGKYNGAALPSGDYWYTLRLNDVKDAREFVGHFTLYR